MKRWFATGSLFVAVAALLVACGSSSGNDVTADADPCPSGLLEQATEPVEVKLWHGLTANNQTTLEALVDGFNASQDRVKVRAIFQGGYAETLDKYLAARRTGSAPDLVLLEEQATQLVIDSESAVPMQACLDAGLLDVSDYLERALAFYTVEGTLWPMPFNVSNPVLYYNKAAFREAGLDPEDPPETFNEVREYSEAIVDAGAADHGLAIEFSAWFIEQWFALAGQPFVNNGNGREGRATEVLFNNDLGLEIFTFLDSMLDDGLAMHVGRNSSGADHLLAIGAGEAAMAVGSSAALGSVFAVLDSGQFPNVEVGVGRLPGPARDGGVLVGGGALYIPKASSAVEQEAAREFLQWLGEPEQQGVWHEGSGYVPIVKSAMESGVVKTLWEGRPQYRVAYDQLLEGPETPATSGPVTGPSGEIRSALVVAMERMALQGVAPQNALDSAEVAANEALAKYLERLGE